MSSSKVSGIPEQSSSSGGTSSKQTDENRNLLSNANEDRAQILLKPIEESTTLQFEPDEPNKYYGFSAEKTNSFKEEDFPKQPKRPSRIKQVLVDQFWQSKKKEWKLMLFVLILFILIIVGLVVIYHFHDEELYYIYYNHNALLHKTELRLQIKNPEGSIVLSGALWKNSSRGKPLDCSSEEHHDDKRGQESLCLVWKQFRKLEVYHFETNNAFCHRIQWSFLAEGGPSANTDCFELGDGVKWFGGGILKDNGDKTLDDLSISRQLFATGGIYDDSAFGPVVERLFLSSKGVAIVMDANTTFELSINVLNDDTNKTDRQLCLHTRSRFYEQQDSVPDGLAYLICVADNVVQVRSEVLNLAFPSSAPTIPPDTIFASPMWSTWAYFKELYDNTTLMQFADQIVAKGFQNSLLMIDDGWETEVGDLRFSASKFPNPGATIQSLHDKNFTVSLQFRPQISTKSYSFQNTTIQSHLVKNIGAADVPGLTRWWNGPHQLTWDRGLVGVYDLTDAEASEMLRLRLLEMQIQYGIDTFHAAGTEVSSLPPFAVTGSSRDFQDPSEYSKQGAELIASFGSLSSSESASRSQDLSVLVRLRGGTSSWDGVGGLQNVVPTALTLGLLGYPLFISDSVGGSAYDQFPTKELFIRWFQVSAFLPIMQLSIPPWLYDAETQEIIDNILRLRERLVLPEMRAVIRDPNDLIQAPIIRPIWWEFPTDAESLGIVSEFLVGNNILVAPVLQKGKLERDIYLPRGLWRDPLLGVNHSGPLWLRKYAASLANVPYFIRQ